MHITTWGALLLVWLAALALPGPTTNLANPKALVFFTALLTQFLPVDAGWGTRLAIIAVMTVTGLVWFVGIALASSASAFRR